MINRISREYVGLWAMAAGVEIKTIIDRAKGDETVEKAISNINRLAGGIDENPKYVEYHLAMLEVGLLNICMSIVGGKIDADVFLGKVVNGVGYMSEPWVYHELRAGIAKHGICLE